MSATCPDCGAPVLFAAFTNGAVFILDPEANATGMYVVTIRGDGSASCRVAPRATSGPFHQTHHCPVVRKRVQRMFTPTKRKRP